MNTEFNLLLRTTILQAGSYWPDPDFKQNIRMYRVVKEVREQFAKFNQIISIRWWHNLKVVVQPDRFNRNPVGAVREPTFAQGLIGLWTKADAVTYFDDLRFFINALPSPSVRP